MSKIILFLVILTFIIGVALAYESISAFAGEPILKISTVELCQQISLNTKLVSCDKNIPKEIIIDSKSILIKKDFKTGIIRVTNPNNIITGNKENVTIIK